MASLYGSDFSDALVLVGFIVGKETFDRREAAKADVYPPEADPHLFGDYGSGYVVFGAPGAFQTAFLSGRVNTTTGIGGFDPKIVDYAYSIRQPTAGAEMGSANVLLPSILSAPKYPRPVQLMLGEFDYLVCLGACKKIYNATETADMFLKAKGVDIYL